MLRRRARYKPQALRDFHDWVASLGCLVCGDEATLHHCTGYADKPGRFSRDDWLVCPLCPKHHLIQFGPRESVEALGHQGFFITYGIDLLAEAMRLTDMRRAA